MFVVCLIMVMTFAAIFFLPRNFYDSGLMAIFVLIIGFLLAIGYFPLLEYFGNGKTIGRKILGIRLVGYVEIDGKVQVFSTHERVSILKLIPRNFLKMCWYFPQPFYFLVVIYFVFFMQKDPFRRTFYDKMLKTLVIED